MLEQNLATITPEQISTWLGILAIIGPGGWWFLVKANSVENTLLKTRYRIRLIWYKLESIEKYLEGNTSYSRRTLNQLPEEDTGANFLNDL